MLWNREIVCVGDGDGVDCRVAVPDREYVFQKDDIIICVLADVEEAYLCLFEKWNSRNLGQKWEQIKRDFIQHSGRSCFLELSGYR